MQEGIVQGFPISVHTWAWSVAGSDLDVALQTFSNMYMLVITDTGTLGTVMMIKCVLSGSFFAYACFLR
jgi:hypothetical protein